MRLERKSGILGNLPGIREIVRIENRHFEQFENKFEDSLTPERLLKEQKGLSRLSRMFLYTQIGTIGGQLTCLVGQGLTVDGQRIVGLNTWEFAAGNIALGLMGLAISHLWWMTGTKIDILQRLQPQNP